MKQFKRAQVIMLPAKKSKLYISSNKKLYLAYKDYNGKELSGCTLHHLYTISDDEIKEGDWCIEGNKHPNLFQVKEFNSVTGIVREINGKPYILDACRKIIATTDTSLKEIIKNHNDFDSVFSYPQPSQQFIEKYIKSYNKGEVIADVLVEYEEKSNEDIQRELGIFGHDEGLLESEYNEYIKTNSIDKLRVNPKDNTITIKKLKDSWNREEVRGLLIKFHNEFPERYNLEQWIKENL